jgi:hypothetical protein
MEQPERYWFEDDRTAVSSRSYGHYHARVLPNKVIAEYYAADTGKSWIAYYSSQREQFVPELDPIISAPLYDNSPLAWVADKHEELYARFPNQWILIENKTVIAHSTSLREIETASRERGMTNAFITKVVPVPKTARLIYASQVL